MRSKLREALLDKKRMCYIVISLIGIALLMFMIIPYAKSASYSVFQGDDFSKAIFMKGSESSFKQHMLLTAKMLKQNYFGKLGFYTSIILLGSISPVNITNLNGLGIIMTINVLVYYFSIVLFIFCLMKNTIKMSPVSIWISVGVIYGLTAYVQAQESFYQLFCATTYTIPMSFMLMGVSLFLVFLRNNRVWIFILGIICGIIGCGGSLVVPALGCSLLALILIYCFIDKKGSSTKIYIWFGIYIVFSLLNTLAPGNFARHQQIDSSGIHPFKALSAAFMMVYKKRYLSLSNMDWVALVVLLVLLGLFIIPKANLNKKAYAIVSIIALAIPFIVAFPVALGYSNFNTYYACPRRVAQIIDLAIMLTISNAALCLGYYLRLLLSNKIKPVVIIISIIAFASFGLDNYSSIESNASMNIWKGLKSGIYQEYNEKADAFLKSLSDMEGEAVVVTYDTFPKPIEEFYCIELSTDPDGAQDNVNLAEYYGLKSLVLQNDQ